MLPPSSGPPPPSTPDGSFVLENELHATPAPATSAHVARRARAHRERRSIAIERTTHALRGRPGTRYDDDVRVRSRVSLGLVAGVALAACNLVTGAADLEVAGGNDAPRPAGGGSGDGAADPTAPSPSNDGGSTTDAAFDAPDAADAGCVSASAPSLLGSATPLLGFYQLTTNTNGLAGGVASATPIPIDDFDASFSYSITYTGGLGAGLAFFAITAAPSPPSSCQPGPPLCTLGASAPGFAVILRTSKGNQGDPSVPYVAVVEAQSYPSVPPVNPPRIDPTLAYTLVNSVDNTTLPPAASFHTMAISARSGKVTVTIDGAAILTGVPIPSWSAGRVSTWGVGASTGLGAGFAERTVIGPVTFNRCP
jgi:hypothetical protein